MIKILGILVYISWGADGATTEYGIKQGLHEGNPIFKNQKVRVAACVVLPIAINYVTGQIYKTHPKLAIGLRAANVATHSYFAIRNINKINDNR